MVPILFLWRLLISHLAFRGHNIYHVTSFHTGIRTTKTQMFFFSDHFVKNAWATEDIAV